MKSLRLTEVLLPLLAARGWAPWRIEPRRPEERRGRGYRPAAAGKQARWRDREHHRLPFDDVQ